MDQNSEIIGGIGVTIDADYSPLEKTFQDAEGAAQKAGEDIASAFGAGAAAGAEQANLFGDAIDRIPWADASGQINLFTTELEPFAAAMGGASEAAGAAGAGLGDFAKSADEAAKSSSEGADKSESLLKTLLEFGGIALSVETLKEFATEALETYANVEKATIAITALTGSATEAGAVIEELKNLSLSNALSFPELVAADQKMIAIGIDAKAIPAALQAAGNAAAATGNSFGALTNAIDRMALSGNAMPRMLATMGLSTQDLATAMRVSADQVKASFAALDPSERVQVIVDALGKYAGVARQTAEGVAGQWQNLKTQTEFAFESFGAAIAPAAAALMQFVSGAVTTAAATFTAMVSAVTTLKEAVGDALHPIENLAVSLSGISGPGEAAASALGKVWGWIKDYNAYALAAKAIQGVADAVGMISTKTPGAAAMFQAADDRLKSLNRTGTDAGPILKAVADQMDKVRASHQQATDTITLLTAQLAEATAKEQDLTDQYKAGKPVLDELVSAQQATKAAQEALNVAMGEGAKQTEQVIQDQNKFVEIFMKVPQTFDLYINSLKAGGETTDQLTKQIDGLINKLKEQALQMSGQNLADVSQLIGELEGLRAKVQEVSSPALEGLGVQLITNATQMAQAQAAAAAAGRGLLGMSDNVLELVRKLDDEQTKLQVVSAQVQGGTKNYEDYLRAKQAVQQATDALAKALEEEAGRVADLNNPIDVANGLLAIAQARLSDLTTKYQEHKATLSEVVSAQQAVASAQAKVNEVTGQGATVVGAHTAAVSAQTSAHQALAPAIDATGVHLGDFGVIEQNVAGAITTTTAHVKAQKAALDDYAAGIEDDLHRIDQAFGGGSTPGPSVGGAPAGEKWNMAVGVRGALQGGGFGQMANLQLEAGYMIDPDTGGPIAISAYVSKIAQQLQQGIISEAAATAAVSGLGLADVNKALGITRGSTPVSTSAPGPAASSVGGQVLIDELQGGTLYKQLSDILFALQGSAGSMAAVASYSAQTTTAITAAAANIANAANTIGTNSQAAMIEAAAITGTLQTVAAAVQVNSKVALTPVGQTPASVAASVATPNAIATMLQNLSNYSANTPVGGLGVAQSVAAAINAGALARSNGGTTNIFNFQGANLANTTQDAVMQGVTQALRDLGAKF